MKKETLLSIATAGLLLGAQNVSASSGMNKEKCYGIAKKGMNDCATKDHSCANKASGDSLAAEWIYVPTGLCEKVAGGSLSPKE